MEKKNFFKFLGLSLLSVVILSGCNSNGNGDDEKVSLSINYYNGAVSETVIENAKKEFKDYNLTFKQVPANNDYDTKLKTSLNSKTAPDITAINSNIYDYLPYADKFVDLKEYGTESLKDKYIQWKWDSTFTNDKKHQIAMPIDLGPTALFYNVDAFKKAGLPTEPDKVSELITNRETYKDAAKTMKEKADMPMYQSAVVLIQEQARTMTKHIFDENGKLIFADGQMKEVWDYAVDAAQKGYTLGIKANSVDGATSTQRGLYGSMVQASWGINDLAENDTQPGQWLIAKAPGNPSNYGGSYLAALKTTDYPKEAAEVIKFLTNEESQKINYKDLALFPSITTAYGEDFLNAKHELFGEEKFNEYFIEAAEELKYIPSDPRESSAIKYFEDQIILVEEQDKNPDDAWNDAVKKVEELAK